MSPESAAAAASQTGAGNELLQLVSFFVGEEEFGLEILRVQEIIRMQPLTRVPHLPKHVEGVINLRGKIIPVVGLRPRMGLDKQAADKYTRIVVVDVKGVVVGFVVDSVSEVLRIPSTAIEATPRLGKTERDYIYGVGKLDSRLLLLIDLEKLMNETEFGELDRERETVSKDPRTSVESAV
jgi:purine-binding chemotaxis protein CheW